MDHHHLAFINRVNSSDFQSLIQMLYNGVMDASMTPAERAVVLDRLTQSNNQFLTLAQGIASPFQNQMYQPFAPQSVRMSDINTDDILDDLAGNSKNSYMSSKSDLDIKLKNIAALQNKILWDRKQKKTQASMRQ